VILCSHRLDEVRQLVGRVIEMREGAIAHDGSLHALLDDLRAFRVEVWLKDGAQLAASFLVTHGFSAAGQDRYAAMLTQREKIAAIEGLVRLHDSVLRDLSVYEVEGIQPAKLRVIA
jgi:ABC-type uncharacterized transport system ATPase subunit